MLISSARLTNIPIMSLQTGAELARAISPIIDPGNLKILAYQVKGPLLDPRKTSFLMIDDIRELGDIGFIVDSVDDLVEYGDVVKLDKVFDLHFPLSGMAVTDEKRRRLGRISGYTIETDIFSVEQLVVKRPLLHRASDTELLVHRSQIIEINNKSIVIHSKAEIPEHTLVTTPGAFVNPFRKTDPAENPTP